MEFISYFNEIYNIQSQLQYIIDFYYRNISYFHNIPLNQFFTKILNIEIIFEPYVKILIDAIDNDIDVLIDLYNYYNLVQVYFNYLFDNIKNFYLYHINKLLFEELYDVAPFYSKSKFIDLLLYIKSYIHKFYPYRNINIYYVLNNIKTIKRIKDETLTGLSEQLKQIKTEQSNYITQIKKKLEDHYSDDFHSYHLNKIQDLAPIINAPTNLSDLRNTLRVIKNNFVYFKKEIHEIREELHYLINLKFFKEYAQLHHSSKPGYDSLMKSFEKDEENFQKFYPHILDTFKNIDYFICEINLMIEIIPNVIPKLKKAKSKLDKRKYIELLLDLLKLESIDNIRGITEFISKNRKSIPTDILAKITLNRRIIIELFIFKNLMNNKNSIELIKESISKTLSIINKLISINKYTDQLKVINNKLNIDNINLSIGKYRLIIREIESLLNEIKFNTIPEIESMIDILEHVKKSMIKRKIYENNRYSQINLQNLLNIIGILNLIKSLIERLRCFKEKLENKLKCLDSCINDMECGIEGVARNFIRCSQQSYTENRTLQVIYVNRNNKTFYNPY